MAHEIETAMFVKHPAWHQLGRVLENAPDARTAIREGGLDWPVELRNVYYQSGKAIREIKDRRAVVRVLPAGRKTAQGLAMPEGDEVLSIVSSDYHPVQNAEAFSFFDPVVQTGKVAFEAAGSLCGGRRIWVLARVGEAFDVARGDQVKPYCLFCNSHDTTLAVIIQMTSVRVVCQNTLLQSLGSGAPMHRLRHDKQVGAQMKNVQDVLGFLQRRAVGMRDTYRSLVQTSMNDVKFDRMIREALAYTKMPVDEVAVSDEAFEREERLRKRFEARCDVIEDLHERGAGATPATRGTLWGGLNAITEFADHIMGERARDHANYGLFGDARKVKDRAYASAIGMLRG